MAELTFGKKLLLCALAGVAGGAAFAFIRPFAAVTTAEAPAVRAPAAAPAPAGEKPSAADVAEESVAAVGGASRSPASVAAVKANLKEIHGWREYAAARGFGRYDRALDPYFEKTPAARAVREVVVLHLRGMSAEPNDVRFLQEAYEAMLADPQASAEAMKGALAGMPNELSDVRNHLVQLAIKVGNSDESRRTVESLLIRETVRPVVPANESAGERFTPALALASYFELEEDPVKRQRAVQAALDAQKDDRVHGSLASVVEMLQEDR